MYLSLKDRINILAEIGEFIRRYFTNNLDNNTYYEFNKIITEEKNHNYWFTEDNVIFALKYWAKILTKENIETWITPYLPKIEQVFPKTIAIIAAGNIPLVCFHDVICSFIAGHKTKLKLSKKDSRILKFILTHFFNKNPILANYITLIEEEFLKEFDAIIATGTNNTIKYFEYYFGKYPHLFRHSRHSIAVLTEEETAEELELLSNDVFIYFGLGCRNVTKIYVPQNYNFNKLINAFNKWSNIIYNHHYANNYNYHKAIYLINQEKFIDTGFLILKENKQISASVGVLFYEYYDNFKNLEEKIKLEKNNIQCIVSKKNVLFLPTVFFGKTQEPNLWDYADNIDTINFLINI
ncbi:MAG: acyl-CoA reductase [Bacteroidales bacterium]|nr:acyl-CoA reductase [Bacteroidales bacterium]